ncbi:hypothetical protein [Shinella sp. JR1-6]|uniref:hypothetical protein n=1 Tax=Shinella sp. JR1-6 TaxID=2527671 RepID=UPI00102D5EFD|nr:hypothetical protein [Shinella sp. JR1-6]TAA54820.1 hypothetical protein EXZ48_25970 [Shinella sp. JR1-6]
MTGRINAFRAAVMADIKIILPQLQTIEPQFGRFNLDELERTSLRCPAVRVAVLNGKLTDNASGQSDASLQCAAFIVTDGKARDEQGWTLAEAIATLLHSAQRWTLNHIGAPEKPSIQPVVSASIKDRGVAIIAVEWTQAIRRLGENIFDEAGVALTELYVNGDEIELPAPGDEP